MGCMQERSGRNDEEAELNYPLRELGFQFIPCIEADLVIRKFSSGDFISSAQLQQILTRLNLQAVESNEVCHSFYAQLSEGIQYRRELLLLACVQLCKGDWAVKATLLFEAYDKDTSRYLNREEFRVMWKSLQTLALEVLPAVLIPSESVGEYLRALHVCSPQALLAAEAELFVRTDNVSLQIFRNRLMIGKLKALLHPRLLRTYIRGFYKEPSRHTEQLTPIRRHKTKKEVDIDERFGFTKQ